ncbi:hypothetical protein [Hoeflea prorocentri]|uniref:Uncharacterized protein n=1 Tax=Hoeflea prorocentri TaxID=1922333 RepID=A0A9X3ZHJ0_9HYPH|nr:hypothetical protein [Hoeflea prorocentri]MCY6380983.1 hypothetical protein [Hoeflea prorocentri]MDA5398783.1 hypothetical protein [Hoeflea prorocentri]
MKKTYEKPAVVTREKLEKISSQKAVIERPLVVSGVKVFRDGR